MKTKQVLKQEAEQRDKEYSKLTIIQKIAKLDSKFGVGVGAKKQRARLHKLENQHGKKV